MIERRAAQYRWGRQTPGFLIILVGLLVVCGLLVPYFVRPQQPDARPVWDSFLTFLVSVVNVLGAILGLCFFFAVIRAVAQLFGSFKARRLEERRSRLQPLTQDARGQANLANLIQVASALGDTDDDVKTQALAATFTLLRANPTLADHLNLRSRLEKALLDGAGFARTLAETPAGADLLQRVTLGAKLGAGTCEKKISPVTSDPLELALWIDATRRHEIPQEVQVSIGYDTGDLPSLAERGRFISLYLFIVTTDLQRFMALMRRPPRDPNAAYGLLIRGDVVEVRYPGQARGRRLDYVFPPPRLSTGNLAGFIREIQLLNLGLLVSCVAEASRVLLGGTCPVWLDARRQAIAGCYRDFERRLVALLRRHDRYRDPECIHKLSPSDHAERVRAFQVYRLEECLYPHYSWVVPLYEADTRWDRLLEPLRAVEGMLLHQGEVPGREITRGVSFIQQMRQLGYETATAIEQVLAWTEPFIDLPKGEERGAHALLYPRDPFIDAQEESATRCYLTRVGQALALNETWPEHLSDPETFRQAAAYYEVVIEALPLPPEMIPEVDP